MRIGQHHSVLHQLKHPVIELKLGFLSPPSFEHGGYCIGDRVEKLQLLRRKIAHGFAVCPHDPVHPILHHHGHAHAGDAAMLQQEPRRHEAGFYVQVSHDHRLPFANRKTRLRMRASLHRQGSDETLAPADTGNEIQMLVRFTRNENFAEFDV